MDSISSAPPPRALESLNQANHHNRSNFGRRLLHSGHFQAILFYFPELSQESTTKPAPAPQTFSPPEGNWGGVGHWRSPQVGQLGHWPSWGLALSAPCGHHVAQVQQVTVTLPCLPGRKRKVTSDKCKRTLETEHGSFYPLLDASWFWLRKFWLQPS